jgi:hypothetical protein
MVPDMRRSLKSRGEKVGKVRIGYELDAPLMHQLRILAAELDQNQSAVLEDAIREYLQKHGRPIPTQKPPRS